MQGRYTVRPLITRDRFSLDPSIPRFCRPIVSHQMDRGCFVAVLKWKGKRKSSSDNYYTNLELSRSECTTYVREPLDERVISCQGKLRYNVSYPYCDICTFDEISAFENEDGEKGNTANEVVSSGGARSLFLSMTSLFLLFKCPVGKLSIQPNGKDHNYRGKLCLICSPEPPTPLFQGNLRRPLF